jgi:outer membrane protein, heavy metal efflux system
MRRYIQLSIYLLIFTLCGCAHYKEKPITNADVNKALSAPSPDALCVLVQSLQHPLLLPVAFNESDGLSPDEAAVMAVMLNPFLKAVRDDRGIADAEVLSTGILPNPTLAGGAAFPLAAPGESPEYSSEMSFEISALVSRRARIDAATAARKSVDLDIAYQEWQIALQARAALIYLFALEEQLISAHDTETRRKAYLAVLQDAATAQEATAVEVAASENAVLNAHAAILDLEREKSRGIHALAAILGVSSTVRIVLQKGFKLSSKISPPTAAALKNGLEERRLDLAALRLGYKSQEASLRAAIRSQFPKMDLGVGFVRDFSRFFVLGPTASVEIPLFDHNQGAIAIETATRQKLYDEYIARVFEARSAIDTIVADIGLLSAAIESAEAAMPTRERLLEIYKDALANGQGDILSLWSAEDDLADAQMEIIRMKGEASLLLVNLESEAGEYLPAAMITNTSSADKESGQ